MSSVKELKSIDLTSFTTISTGVSVLFSVILALVITAAIAIISPGNIGVSIYIIPTIIVGTFMWGIYSYFSNGLFYNLLANYLKTIKLTISEDGEITKISNIETAMIYAIIATIQAVLLYFVSSFILPVVLNATVQTLMIAGEQSAAYGLYQILILLNQPTTVLLAVFGTFIISFIFILLGTYIYNILASTGRGILLKLSKENNLTVIESIDKIKFAIAFAAVNGVLSIILAIILIITNGNALAAIGSAIEGIVGGFIIAIIVASFYNYLAPKLGKLKLELIDQ